MILGNVFCTYICIKEFWGDIDAHILFFIFSQQSADGAVSNTKS
jgi:hypothetical protein